MRVLNSNYFIWFHFTSLKFCTYWAKFWSKNRCKVVAIKSEIFLHNLKFLNSFFSGNLSLFGSCKVEKVRKTTFCINFSASCSVVSCVIFGSVTWVEVAMCVFLTPLKAEYIFSTFFSSLFFLLCLTSEDIIYLSSGHDLIVKVLRFPINTTLTRNKWHNKIVTVLIKVIQCRVTTLLSYVWLFPVKRLS